jgi:Protein of unknown function (DUF1236)
MRILRPLIPAALIAAILPAAALAQGGGAAGAAGGAAAGAIVGGPVGAVVGGVLGAVIGTTIAPPPAQVVTYVTAQPAPTAVTLQGNLVVGATLPEAVVLTPIPANVYTAPAGATAVVYSYAYVNGKKVVVDNKTRAVVAIVG